MLTLSYELAAVTPADVAIFRHVCVQHSQMEPCTALATRECLLGGLVARCEERHIAIDEVSPRICSCEGSVS